MRDAIAILPEEAWTAAVDADGEPRDGAQVADLTGLLDHLEQAGWPPGVRVLVRREHPHPGAQLTLADVDGWRYQCFATNTALGQHAWLEARHRAHARVGRRPGESTRRSGACERGVDLRP